MGNTLQRAPLAAALTALILAIAISACGGGGSSSSESPTSPTEGNAAPAGGTGNPLSLGGKGASSFIRPNSPNNNQYAKFGTESNSAERAAASKVLAKNLEAREAADFGTQCATLSVPANEEVSKVSKNPKKARSQCAGALEELAKPFKSTKQFRVDNFDGEIAALRVKGIAGYALFHGKDGNDWMMPMLKEGGVWWVNSISTIEV